MMKLSIQHQEQYSRGELLLRTFFGWLYIMIPHGFLLFFIGLWALVLQFVAFWVILFTARYPETMFEFQLGLLKWNLRLNARLLHLADGYPAFGMRGTDEHTELEVPYPEKVSRGLTLVRMLFGLFYVALPHGIVLIFRSLYVGILIFAAWWIVLITARYPDYIFAWVSGQIRWEMRVNIYLLFMTDVYPPFSGDELPDEDSGVNIKVD